MKRDLSKIDWTRYTRTPSGMIKLKKELAPNKPGRKKGMVLNEKDAVFAREFLLNGGNATKAAKVSDPMTYKRMAVSRKKRLTFSLLLDKKGVSDSVLATLLREGLHATKIHSSPTEPDREVKDFAVRHKYLETALKVKGHMNNIENQNNIQVNILDYKENE